MRALKSAWGMTVTALILAVVACAVVWAVLCWLYDNSDKDSWE